MIGGIYFAGASFGGAIRASVVAVNTRNKRFAFISLGFWKGRVLPEPDGTFDDALDRVQLALLYPHDAFLPGPITFLPHYGANVNKTSGLLIHTE